MSERPICQITENCTEPAMVMVGGKICCGNHAIEIDRKIREQICSLVN